MRVQAHSVIRRSETDHRSAGGADRRHRSAGRLKSRQAARSDCRLVRCAPPGTGDSTSQLRARAEAAEAASSGNGTQDGERIHVRESPGCQGRDGARLCSPQVVAWIGLRTPRASAPALSRLQSSQSTSRRQPKDRNRLERDSSPARIAVSMALNSFCGSTHCQPCGIQLHRQVRGRWASPHSSGNDSAPSANGLFDERSDCRQ